MTHIFVGVLYGAKSVVHSQIFGEPQVDPYGIFEAKSFTLPKYEWQCVGAAALRDYQFDQINYGNALESIPGFAPSYTLESVIKNRGHEIIGWLLNEGHRRPHSTTIEAKTDEEAVVLAKGFSLPPYEWQLRRVNRLSANDRQQIFEDASIDDIPEKILLGHGYEVLGWYIDQSGTEEPWDHPLRLRIYAHTDAEAVLKTEHITPSGDYVLGVWQISRIESDGKKVVVHEDKSQTPVTEADFERDKRLFEIMRGKSLI